MKTIEQLLCDNISDNFVYLVLFDTGIKNVVE